MRTESIGVSIVVGALSAGLFFPGCGVEEARGRGPQAAADPPGAAASAVTREPIQRTVTLAPYRAHPRDRAGARIARPMHGGGALGSVFPQATPTSIVSAGGDSVGIYQVNGDATSADSVSNQGGAIIASAHLELIFWGSQWQTATGPSESDVVTAFTHLLASTYLDELKQYGWQSADVRGVTNVPSAPPQTFVDNDMGDFVWGLIDQNVFPEPNDAGGDNLYVVILPSSVTAPPGEIAAHGADSDYDPFDVEWARYTWIQQANIDLMTEAFSHELVEAISDPQDPAWIMDRVINSDGPEIGDACNRSVDVLDGIVVQGYWSQQQHACVIPFQPPPTITSVSPNEGPEVGGQVVTITGTNFDTFGSTKIFFAGTAALNVSCSSHTTCTVTTPPGYGIEDAQATVNRFAFTGSSASQYLFGPGVPWCSASYACEGNNTGATTIWCPFGLTHLTLQRFDGVQWQPVSNPNTTQTPNAFMDFYYPPAGTSVSYEVTDTDSTGTAVTPPMTIVTTDCTCYWTTVCQLPNGQQIYPSIKSPPNWCSAKGGHYVKKQVCP